MRVGGETSVTYLPYTPWLGLWYMSCLQPLSNIGQGWGKPCHAISTVACPQSVKLLVGQETSGGEVMFINTNKKPCPSPGRALRVFQTICPLQGLE